MRGDNLINLNYRDSRPIYEQIRDSFKNLITAGGIKPDEKMPSVRELATVLAINPNTIQRAYRELETEGYIYSVPGKGSFATDKNDLIESRKNELLQKFDGLVTELKSCGISDEMMISRITGEGGK